MSHPRAKLAALCDLREETLAAAGEALELPDSALFTDYGAMLSSGLVDTVSICVPNVLHEKLCVAAFEAGMNVLTEKPLARNADEGRRILTASKKSGKLGMIQFNNRYRAESIALKQMVDAYTLGNLYSARCGWVRRNGIPGWGDWFTSKEKAGGGCVIDLGVHMLDLTWWLMGRPKPKHVLGATFANFGPRKLGRGPWGTVNEDGVCDIEDHAMAQILFADGRTVQIEVAWASMHEREVVYSEVFGTQGSARLERVFEVDGIDDSSLDSLSVRSQEHGLPFNREAVLDPSPSMGRVEAVQHFVDSIANGTEPCSPIADGLALMEMLDAIYKSAEDGAPVTV
jgi:predicted dehydrogenase